jgi:hypothetical protein
MATGAVAGSKLMPVPQLKPIAGAVGAGAALFPQLFAPNLERQAEAQQERGEEVDVDASRAAKAAAVQTALESMGGAALLGKRIVRSLLGKPAAKLTEKEVLSLTTRSLGNSVARRAAGTAAVEMPTEIGQQIIERHQAGLTLTSDEAMSEYAEAAYLAGLVGGGFGSVQGVGQRITRPKVPGTETQEAPQSDELKEIFGGQEEVVVDEEVDEEVNEEVNEEAGPKVRGKDTATEEEVPNNPGEALIRRILAESDRVRAEEAAEADTSENDAAADTEVGTSTEESVEQEGEQIGSTDQEESVTTPTEIDLSPDGRKALAKEYGLSPRIGIFKDTGTLVTLDQKDQSSLARVINDLEAWKDLSKSTENIGKVANLQGRLQEQLAQLRALHGTKKRDLQHTRPIDAEVALEVEQVAEEKAEEQETGGAFKRLLAEFTPASALKILLAEGAYGVNKAVNYTDSRRLGSRKRARDIQTWLYDGLSEPGRAYLDALASDIKADRAKLANYQVKDTGVSAYEHIPKFNKEVRARMTKVADKPEIDAIKAEPGKENWTDKQALKEIARRKNDKVAAIATKPAAKSDLAEMSAKKDPALGGEKKLDTPSTPEERAAEQAVFDANPDKEVEVLPEGPGADPRAIISGPLYKGKELSAELVELMKKSFTVKEALKDALGNQPKEIQRILKKIDGLNLKTKIVVREPKGEQVNHGGQYDPNTDTITLFPHQGINEATVLHEVVHAAISTELDNPSSIFTKEFTKFFNTIKSQLGDSYGGQNLQEFAAELVSNPEFQALLKTIQPPKGKQNMFSTIMDAIAKFFGFRKGQNAYEQGLKYVSDIVDISNNTVPVPGDVLFAGNPKAGLAELTRLNNLHNPNTAETASKAMNFLNKIKDTELLRKAYGLIRMDNIHDAWKTSRDETLRKAAPRVKALIDAIERRIGYVEQRIKDVNRNYVWMQKVQKTYKSAMQKMGELALEIRLAEIDFLAKDADTKYKNNKKYQGLKNRLNNLPAPVRKVYMHIIGEYKGAYNQYLNHIQKHFPPSVTKKLKKEFEAAHPRAGYVPQSRFGDFFLDFNISGERVFLAFADSTARKKAIKELGLSNADPENPQYKLTRSMDDVSYDSSRVPSGSFIHSMMSEIDKENAKEKKDKDGNVIEQDPSAAKVQKDAIYKAYLSLFPAGSLARNQIKAQDVAGANEDMVRVYGDTMVKWARKMGDTIEMPKINEALDWFKEQGRIEGGGNKHIAAVSRNFTDKAEFFRNPTYAKWASTLTMLSFSTFLLGNISSGVVNLSALGLMTLPIIGSRYGTGAALGQMKNAAKTASLSVNSKDWGGKKGDELYDLYQYMKNHGQLEHTLAREVLEGHRQTSDQFTGTKAKIMMVLAAPMAATERYNRAVTGIAAYRAARKGGNGVDPMSKEDAIQYAVKTVKDVNTSGTAATGAAIMQSDIGRTMLTFRSFNWNSAYVTGKSLVEAMRREGLDKGERRIAVRQAMGIFTMSAMMAGVSGLPFLGAATVIASIINSLIGDDDEYFDPKEEMRIFFGELGYNGPLNMLTQANISSRIAMANDLLWRDDPQSIAEHGLVRTAMATMFGPMGSQALSIERGVDMMRQGKLYRGVETSMPSFIRNPLRAMRYVFDGGVLTLRGDDITTDLNAYNIVMQMGGFSPEPLADLYARRGAASEFDDWLSGRKSGYLNAIYAADKIGDTSEKSRLTQKLEALGMQYPGLVDNKTIERSITARKRAEEESLNGLRLSKIGQEVGRDRYELGED